MQVIDRLRRMSVVQLRALERLASASNGLAGSSGVGREMGVTGKSLGGVFSSVARQRVNGEPLILPWGKMDGGRGLRWKINDKLVTSQDLLIMLKELLQYE